jgi:TPR repeat protein
MLAQLHIDGKYLSVDRTRARDAANKACALRSLDGCNGYVRLAETKAGVAAGLNALCSLKQFDACMEFGRMAEQGDGIARDNLRAMFAYRSAMKIDPNSAEAKRRHDEVSKKPVS